MKDESFLKKQFCFSKMAGRKWHFLFLVLFLLPFYVLSQGRDQVRGYVFDAAGQPLAGAMVKAAETFSVGTYTDLQGEFTLNVEEGSKLEISFIGYNTQTVAAKNGMKVVLSEVSRDLDEVVVVGYGTQRRSDITGAISSINSAKFSQQQTFRATDILQGRVAGVNVANTSGTPFGETKIRIRGANSINGGNDPLFVVNGVLGASMPDAEDIESIEVLKDASATALYGSRGANGVILITTKKGVAGKTQITVDVYGTLQTPSKYYDVLDPASYAEAYNYTMGNNVFSEDDIAKYRQGGGTDWQREVLQEAWIQRYRLNVSGGSEKYRFYLSADYKKQESMIVNKHAEYYGLSGRFDADIFKNLKFEWNIDLRHNKKRNDAGSDIEGGGDGVLFAALNYSPTDPVFIDDAHTQYLYHSTKGASGGNPVTEVRERDSDEKGFNTISNMAFTWKIVEGLTAQYRFDYEHKTAKMNEFRSNQYTLGKGANAYGRNDISEKYFQNIVLNYNKTFDKHSLALTGVLEGSKYEEEKAVQVAYDFENSSLGYWGLSSGKTKYCDINYGNEALLSYVARVNYNYASKYYLTATFRRDGSSKFADGHKWGNFPSASIAWRMSEEKFIKKWDIFSNLKIRASYGVTGNQGIDRYATISQLKTNTENGVNEYSPYYDQSTVTVGYAPLVVNSSLTWEKTTQFDLGMDASVFGGRLSATLDLYKKRTSDLLLTETSPYYLGGDQVTYNKGKVDNKGIEAAVTVIPFETRDLYWEVTANIAKNVNKIVNIGPDPIYLNAAGGNNDGILDNKTHILKNGISMGSLYGWRCLGVWQSSEAAEAARYGQQPGDWKYADLDKNGSIDEEDRVILGNGTPDFTVGLNSFLRYKNFDFNLMLHGAFGSEMLNVMYASMSTRASKSPSITLREGWEKAWRPDRESNEFANPQSTTAMMKYNSDRWMQNSSFLRIKNLSIGYTLKKNIVKFGEIRLYASSQNLLTITKYKGYDPEITATMGSDAGTGIDSGICPLPRSFTFGAQVKF